MGYSGYINFIAKSGKNFSMVSESNQLLLQLEKMDQAYREYSLVTVVYLSEPKGRRLLSEELGDLPLSADVVTTQRRKFFEWSDNIATARVFPNEQRNTDLLFVEILTTKLTLSQGKFLLAPLLALSSRVVLHCSSEDLISSLTSAVALLTPALKDGFNLTSMRGYDWEGTLDIAANELSPKLTLYSTNSKLQKLVSEEGKAPVDIMEYALSKATGAPGGEATLSQFMVLFKSRELIVGESEGALPSLRQSLLSDSSFAPKTFFGRRVKATPSLQFEFLDRHLSQKGKDDRLDFKEV